MDGEEKWIGKAETLVLETRAGFWLLIQLHVSELETIPSSGLLTKNLPYALPGSAGGN